MPTKSKKQPGHDWEVFIRYLEDGEDDSLQVESCWTAEEAIAKARDELNAFAKSDNEKDQFEIMAVVRSDAEI
jgi:hypothetical protein